MLEDIAHPINQRFRPINPNLEPALRKQLDAWLEHDVIQPSNSPWNFGLVAAKKKDGRLRWCVDYRQLNKKTVKDRFPIGNINDNLNRLSHSTIFSTIDGSGAFHVIPLRKQDRKITAFATPFGCYEFKRLPFGLCNGPSTYARLVKLVLSGIPYNVALPYLDDTVVHSRDIPTHFRDLDVVLQAHSKAGLRLQPSKCHLFCDSTNYLGHTISRHGITPMSEYLDVVKTWPMPTTRAAVRAWLGKVGYYRRFIKNFAAISKPLSDKLVKDSTSDKQEFTPSPEFKQSFNELRDRLVTAPILAYPDFNGSKFILDTDWSAINCAIGGVLSQVQDGNERVIAYGAKKLTKCQRNYAPHKGELFAMLYFMNYWRYFLLHHRFIFRTDHQALTSIRLKEPPEEGKQGGLMSRWFMALATFDFDIVYRPGKRHINADALSRAPHLSDPVDDRPFDNHICGLCPSPVTSLSDPPTLASLLDLSGFYVSNADLKSAQQTDPDIGPAYTSVETATPPTKHELNAATTTGRIYLHLYDSLCLDPSGVLRLYVTASPRGAIICPSSLITRVIWAAHLDVAHRGPQATMEALTPVFFFHRMFDTIRDTLLACAGCQCKTRNSKDQRHTLRSFPMGFPFQRLTMDFVGPLTPSYLHRNKYILTLRCTFTRWTEAFPITKATAAAVVSILETHIFPRFGIPEVIHTDRGTQFTGNELHALAQRIGFQLSTTPAYNPKSNQVERAHKDIGLALRALVTDGALNANRWEDALPQILMALRFTTCRSTGFSPFEMMFGRRPMTPLAMMFGQPNEAATDSHSHSMRLRKILADIHATAGSTMALQIRRNRPVIRGGKEAIHGIQEDPGVADRDDSGRSRDRRDLGGHPYTADTPWGAARDLELGP